MIAFPLPRWPFSTKTTTQRTVFKRLHLSVFFSCLLFPLGHFISCKESSFHPQIPEVHYNTCLLRSKLHWGQLDLPLGRELASHLLKSSHKEDPAISLGCFHTDFVTQIKCHSCKFPDVVMVVVVFHLR